MEGELLSLSAAFCWALGASIYKKSLSNVSPLILNLFRSSSAAMLIFLLLFPLQSLNHISKLSLSLAGLICFTSLVTWGLGDTLYFLGLKLIGVGKTVPMTYSYPLFVLPISTILNRYLSSSEIKKMVGRVGFEPTTIGLKDSHLIYQVFINQSLTVLVHLHCAHKR